MTLEEAKQLAENGDIGAMISLGDYYIQNQKTGDDTEEAAKWYEMAARRKVVYAIHMTVLTKKILAHSGLLVADKVEYGTKFALDEWKDVYEWAAEELDCINNNVPGSEQIKINDAIQNFEEASYYFALCCYWENKYYEASELVSDFDDVRSKILYGAALIQLAQKSNEMAKAVKILESVIFDKGYAAADKYSLEEDVYALAALQLSMLHREAGSQSDMEFAVTLLSFISSAVKRDNNKQIINKELSRYQKKLFGGYRYV